MMMLSAVAVIMVGATAMASQPASSARSDPRPESKLWIEGGSNVTNWSCKATMFEAHTDLDSLHSSGDEASVPTERIKRISVKVAVRNLKCGNGRMEKDLYNALKANDPSAPSYIVGVFDALRVPEKGESHVDTEGTIAVVGVEKGVRLRITMDRLADGTVVARGSVPLLMTDFGVTPPTGLFGLIKSKNQIVVKFEVVIDEP